MRTKSKGASHQIRKFQFFLVVRKVESVNPVLKFALTVYITFSDSSPEAVDQSVKYANISNMYYNNLKSLGSIWYELYLFYFHNIILDNEIPVQEKDPGFV